eukprot:UN26761
MVAAGYQHSCALKASVCLGKKMDDQEQCSKRNLDSCEQKSECLLAGKIVCWGDDANNIVSGVPDETYLSISEGGYHVCALNINGY